MLAKRIIPCLDVKDGRVVKGTRFVNLRDAGDPVEVATVYDEQEADEITFLDITASHEDREIMIDVVRRTAERVFMPLTVGGGIRNVTDIRNLLRAGADKVSINTSAVLEPGLISASSRRFGSQCIVVAVDAKQGPRGSGSDLLKWEVYVYGGRTPTGRDAIEWAVEAEERGAGELLLTSMDRDGTRGGYDLELTRQISRRVSIPVIASGGAGSLEDIYRVLTEGEADAALAASMFHFRQYAVQEVKRYLHERGVVVRL